MWANNVRGNDIVNEHGQAVRLYIPSLYHGGRESMKRSVFSTIGGPLTTGKVQICPRCSQPLSQLVNFNVPKRDFNQNQTSWIILACNSSECFSKIFDPDSSSESDSKRSDLDSRRHFVVGGQGVVVCERVSKMPDTSSTDTKAVSDYLKVDSGDGDDNETNDWDVSPDGPSSSIIVEDNTGENDMADLEKKLASIEATGSLLPVQKTNNQKPHSSKNDYTQTGKESIEQHHSSFPLFRLSEVREPPASRLSVQDADPDDVGLSTDSQDHIQRMLQKYMEEEEDMDIVNMLQQQEMLSSYGGNSAGGRRSHGGVEEEPDQPLSSDDRTLFHYLDRIKRSPRQVIRYAPGGIPMWSMCVSNLVVAFLNFFFCPD